ncbi:carotenoid ester lipase precursor [Mycena sp. CBHHK59/15]|nr:carotenoid ester lipase precursor [Mycena sp. CBHHK59/15]
MGGQGSAGASGGLWELALGFSASCTNILVMFTLVPVVLITSLSSGLGVAAISPTVALQYATFQGVNDGNLTKFLGVPFAQPALRFELPKPPTLLHGVQNATAFGAACPQQALSPLSVPFTPPNYSAISEDCLTLNVFKPSPADSHSKLPVFVWIYGGGFELGNSADTDVRPVVERSIATGEPVIVVTPNYRVSAFGFLGGKEAGSAGITNLGLRDQIFALQWVQQHIAAFGGDPNRVVIGGPSAGAISTGMLLLSNDQHSSALFRGAFMLSGSPISTGSVADGQPYYDELVTANNCIGSRDTLDCLKRVPFDSFMATVNNTINLFSYSSIANIWRPRVDGDVIVQDPLISVSEGLYAKIPIMTGDSDDEGTLFSFSNTNVTTNAEFLAYVQSNYLPTSTPSQIEKIGVLYPDDPTQGSPFDTGSANQLTPEFKRLAAFQGDFTFTGVRRFFLEHASTRQDAWSWVNKRGKLTPILGSSHGSDLGIWFPTNTTENIGVDALVNFINTLDPNRSAARGNSSHPSVFWPKWKVPSSSGRSSLLTFSDPEGVNITAENFRVDAIKFLNNLLFEAALTK